MVADSFVISEPSGLASFSPSGPRVGVGGHQELELSLSRREAGGVLALQVSHSSENAFSS